MAGKYFDEIAEGDVFRSGTRSVLEVDIVNYNNLMRVTGPLHNDLEYMERESMFKGRVAPGTFVLGFVLGLLTSIGWTSGTALSVLEYSSLKFLHPVRPGDTLSATSTVQGRRETSKPDRGVVTLLDRAVNQRGEAIFEGQRKILLKRRAAASA